MKKCIFALLTIATMLLSVAAPALAMGDDHVYYVYTSNGGPLNLRSSTKTNADNLVTTIPYGEQVNALEMTENGKWAYITWKDYSGYVQTRYLMDTKPDPLAGHTDSAEDDTALADELASMFKGFTVQNYDVQVRASTPGNYVNLRWGPSTLTAVQERVTDGSTLHVLAQNSKWAQVQDPATGKVGFMMRSFLKAVVITPASTEATPIVPVNDQIVLNDAALGMDIVMKTPADYTVTYRHDNGHVYLDMTSPYAIGANYAIVVGFSEEYAGKTMNTMAPADITHIINTLAVEFAAPQVKQLTTASGTLLLALEESGSQSSYACVLTVYHGYFITVHINHSDYAALTDADVQTAVDLLSSMQLSIHY